MDGRSFGRAAALAAVGTAMLLAPPALAATKLKNTGITLNKAAHEAGRLVIVGTTARAKQKVILDSPVASKTSSSKKAFTIQSALVPGDCEIALKVGTKVDVVRVSSCGPTGPRGATGATGPQGAMGPAGAVGPDGPAGPAGADGATGSTGGKGEDGDIGPTGAQGPTGPSGVVSAHREGGSVGDLLAMTSFTFIGTPMEIEITDYQSQRILFTGSAVLGNTTGNVSGFDFEACIRDTANPQSIPDTTGDYLTFAVSNIPSTYTISDLRQVPANGTWQVGLCYRSGEDVMTNDYYRTTAAVIAIP